MALYPGIISTDSIGGTGQDTGAPANLGQLPASGQPTTAAPGTSAPPKADDAAKTLVTGLLDALKRVQDEALAKGTIEYPDTYNIILDPLLEQAKVVPPGSVDLKGVPMAANQTARQQLDERTQAVDKNSKKFSILAGTSILQFLDQVVRNTTYIYEQQTKYYDPKTKELKPNGKPANITGWYRIGMQAVPQGANRYDRKRNDYAYDITYRVEVYGVNDAKSDFFPSAQYRGVHKRYDYWFTGLNTQVLDYQQDFNYLYYIVQNANAPVRTRTTNWREVPKYFFQPRSEQSDQMNEGAVSEPSAQLADYLYSPGDTAKIKLKIIGDPAWIQQGDVRGGLPQLGALYDAFLPDGTISYAGQEILFEVLWNKPADYDLTTGLMDPGVNNYNSNRKAGQAGDAVQSHVYRATRCVSTFSKGQFTQELEGAQIYYELPQAQQQAQQQRERTNQATVNDSVTRKPGFTFLPNELPVKTQGLAAILDSNPAKPSRNLPTDSVRTSDYFPAPTSPAGDAISATQTVGLAAESQAVSRTLGGAAGPDVGVPPTVNLYLNNQEVVQVSTQSEIQSYTGQASPQARAAAAARLNIAQSAAQNPVTSRPPQIIAKEA
jgi:hypothetical protein